MAERWQDYERKYLRQATKDTEIEIIARKLERSESAVIREARRLKLRRIGGTSLHYRNKKQPLRKWRHLIKPCDKWSQQELALFFTHSNQQIAEITGRSVESIGDRRLLENLRRNGWITKN